MSTRTLVILRHAKAANPDGVIDVDRPLTERGQLDARAAGAWLVEQGIVPDLVLCSPARRTRETWHGVALALAAAPEVRYADDVYNASLDELLDVIHTADGATTVLLIGHNPGLAELSAVLDPSGALPNGFPTSAIAVHRADRAWPDWAARAAPRAAEHVARG